MAEANRTNCLAQDDILAVPNALLRCPLCQGRDQQTISQNGRRRLLKCENCGVSFVYPQPTSSSVATHFQDSPELDQDEARNKFERNRERVLSGVASHILRRKKKGRILDVGCATGFFLKRFFDTPDWQTWGVELSSSRADRARKCGITVHNGSILSADFCPCLFDVITVLDTFYYFPQPQTDLKELHRVLSPDGILVIELPLSDARIWRTSGRFGKLISGTRLPLLRTSDHLFFYNPKSVCLLLRKCGFQVQTIAQLPGNRQQNLSRNIIYDCYWLSACVLSRASNSKIILGPRFLVVAQKN